MLQVHSHKSRHSRVSGFFSPSFQDQPGKSSFRSCPVRNLLQGNHESFFHRVEYAPQGEGGESVFPVCLVQPFFNVPGGIASQRFGNQVVPGELARRFRGIDKLVLKAGISHRQHLPDGLGITFVPQVGYAIFGDDDIPQMPWDGRMPIAPADV